MKLITQGNIVKSANGKAHQFSSKKEALEFIQVSDLAFKIGANKINTGNKIFDSVYRFFIS